jgi:hypothetical protein
MELDAKLYKSCNNNLKNVFTKLSHYSSCKNLIPQDFYNRITEQDEPVMTVTAEDIKPPVELLVCEINIDNSILNDDDITNLKTPKECENTEMPKIQFDDSFTRYTQYGDKVVSTKSSIDKITPVTSRSNIKANTKPRFNIPIPPVKGKSSSVTTIHTAREQPIKKTKSIPIARSVGNSKKHKSEAIITEDDTIIKELQTIFGDNLEEFNEEGKLVLNNI